MWGGAWDMPWEASKVDPPQAVRDRLRARAGGRGSGLRSRPVWGRSGCSALPKTEPGGIW